MGLFKKVAEKTKDKFTGKRVTWEGTADKALGYLQDSEAFLKDDFRTASTENLSAIVENIALTNRMFGNLGEAPDDALPDAARGLSSRLSAMSAKSAEISAYLKTGTDLREKQEANQKGLQGAPGRTRYASLLSGLEGDS